MKSCLSAWSILVLSVGLAWAIPSDINYQGTLREKGIPVTGTKTMSFSIYNKGNSTPLWSSGPRAVDVKSGLFATQLSPTGIDWQSVTPELEVVVEGIALSPREAIRATIYANVAGSVTNGSIKLSNLSSEVVAVPPGVILMFNQACPSGWSRFVGLDGRFPLGQSTPGGQGGSNTHSHSLGVAEVSGGRNGAGNVGWSNNLPAAQQNSLGNWGATPGPYTVNIASRYTDSISNVPAYYGVVFCTKN